MAWARPRPATLAVGVPFALRVGAVGHLDAPDTPALKAAIARTIDDLAAIAEDLAAAGRGLGLVHDDEKPEAKPSPARCALVSCLSPGPDQWLAEAALARRFALVAVLPFEAGRYTKPFPPAARAAFVGLRSAAAATLTLDGLTEPAVALDAAYAQAARVMLANVDVVVAVWDRSRPEKPGGTSHTIGLARRAGLPVVWIDPDDAMPRLLVGAPGTPAADYDRATLARVLAAGAMLPDDATDQGEIARAMASLAAETCPAFHAGKEDFTRWRPAAVPGLVALLGAGVSAGPARDKPEADQVEPPIADDNVARHGWRGLFQRYAAFNAWGVVYAALYRRAQTLIYVLAGAALSAAIAALYVHLTADAPGAHGVHALGWWVALIEFALLLAILALMTVGRWRRWHDRSLDYRIVAEILRAGAYLSLLGRAVPPATLAAASRAAPAGRGWAFVYAGLALRAFATVPLTADAASLAARRDYIAANLVADQIAYHRGKQKRSHARERGLRLASEIAFFLTLAVVAYEIVAPLVAAARAPSPKWLGMASGILPAIAWACYGIRNHLELEIVIGRSAAMERHLGEVAAHLAALDGAALTLDALDAATREAVEHMIGDVAGWALMFDVKPMEAA
jgi:hypothetical protein